MLKLHPESGALYGRCLEALVVQFILILMKIMFKGAVVDEYFDDRAYLQVERQGILILFMGYAKRSQNI